MKDTVSSKKRNTKKTSISNSTVSKRVEDVKVVSKKETEKVAPSKNNKNLSYGKKIFVYASLLLVFFALSLFFARKTLTKEDTKPINYTEKETIDYKVYLKENDFYTEKYLPKDKAYIASLIDHIDIDLNYLFNIVDRLTTMSVNYKVMAELVIENANGSNRYYEKEYTLIDTKNREMKGTNELAISESIKIDYDYYNQLANKFRSSYGVETNSYLRIYMALDKQTASNLNYLIKDSTKVDNVTIPLSQRAIEIKINSTSNLTSKLVIPEPIVKVNIPYLVGEIICFVIAAFALIKLINCIMELFFRKTIYDRYVNRLLKDYDRLIIEINTTFDFSNYNIIEVRRFNELLDVRDNIKMPINYYNIVEHEKGVFFIKNDNDIYLLLLKNENLKNKNFKNI